MNVLINDGRALITDFGISKKLDATRTNATTSSDSMKGVAAYVEPQYYIHCEEEIIIPNKKSDIYSLGVLFWELTSGIPPFSGFPEMAVMRKIMRDEREKTIDNTPLDYANLYKRCWSTEPDQRPFSDEILDEINKLLADTAIEFIINNVNNKNILKIPNTLIDSSSTHNSQISILSKGSRQILPEIIDKLSILLLCYLSTY